MARLFPLLLAALLAAAPPPARAAEPTPDADASLDGTAAPALPNPVLVEQVDVSAGMARERREPASFTTVSRDEIERRNRGQDLAVLLAETPNAYAYSDAGNGVGYSYLSLRGFDQRRIAVNINGIPLNTPETHQVYFIDLADFAGNLETMQVQRGTGTALYGSPAVGGVVNLQTRHLSLTPEGEARVGFGSFNTRRFALGYGGPLPGGAWAWQARVSHVSSDGYRDNAWTRHTLVSLALERFGADSTLRINLYGGPERTQLAYYGVPIEYLRGEITGDADRDRRANFLRPGETDTFFQPHLEVLFDWRPSERVTFSNVAYATWGSGYYRQYDAERDWVRAYDATGYPAQTVAVTDAWRRRQIDEWETGWIPRASFAHRGGSFTAGLEVMLHGAHHRGWITEGRIDDAALGARLPLYDYRNTKQTYRLFAREALQPIEPLLLYAELSAITHRYGMHGDRLRGLAFDASYSWLAPRVGATWNVTPAWNLYASASGGASEPPVRDIWDQQDPYVRPRDLFGGHDGNHYSGPRARNEKLVAYEAGAGWQAGTARIKANVYRMEFRDELVFAGGLDDDGNPITRNAGRSVHEGIEIEGAGRLPGKIDIAGYYAQSRDELRDLVLAGSTPGARADYSGNRVALFPGRTARLSIARAFGPLWIRLGGRHVGRIYLDNSENERKNPAARSAPGYVDKLVEPYTLADLSARLDLARWLPKGAPRVTIDLSVDNLLDSRYVQFGYSYPNEDFSSFYTEFFPGATRSVYLGTIIGF